MKTYKELQSKVVPASAKIDHIDNQYLEPASRDKKVRAKVFGTPELMDGEKFQAITFDTAKNMKRDTSKDDHITTRGDIEMPLIKEAFKIKNPTPESRIKIRKSGGDDLYSWALFVDGREKWNGMSKSEATWRRKEEIGKLKAKDLKEDVDDVIHIHTSEAYDLLDEIIDLLDNTNAPGQKLDPNTIKFIASSLRSTRDSLLYNVKRYEAEYDVEDLPENYIVESFKAGRITLNDGSKVRLSAGDAKYLNRMLDSTSTKKNMADDLMKSKKDFDSILSFARDLNEEDLQEISTKKLDQYLVRASSSHSMANMGKRSTEGKGNDPHGDHEYWKRVERNRRKGISTATKKLDKRPIKESDDRLGGHPANYRNPAEKPLKFQKAEAQVPAEYIAVITNDVRNIIGTKATKVGDVVKVKYDRGNHYRMEVIEMLPNNKIKVKKAKE